MEKLDLKKKYKAYYSASAVPEIRQIEEVQYLIILLQQFIEQHGWRKAGIHHEIYLSDIRRVVPEKWRTILREPVG